MDPETFCDLSGQVGVLTGGAGVLCSTMARGLSRCGAKIAVLDIDLEGAERVAAELRRTGAEAMAIRGDVLDKVGMKEAAESMVTTLGGVDFLINGAGGNRKEATTSDELSFFDLSPDAIRWVFELNCLGTILPSQVFGQYMAERGSGRIVNISSMAAICPLTRTVAYSAAKAAVSNFTQWLAVHMSHNYSTEIRVNAIAPGFLLTEQNRYLLIDQETGGFTERGQAIIDHTPMERLGDPEELVGSVAWLLSESASFVHGAVIPIDGGFSAFSGV
jgi:NAD(P)-dependent dehydrogenase (short-subunit alcohol dehydrogenase family)